MCINVSSTIYLYCLGMCGYSSVGEIICQCSPACKNLVQELQHLNKEWNAFVTEVILLKINLFCRKQWIQLFQLMNKFVRVMSTVEYQVLFIVNFALLRTSWMLCTEGKQFVIDGDLDF